MLTYVLFGILAAILSFIFVLAEVKKAWYVVPALLVLGVPQCSFKVSDFQCSLHAESREAEYKYDKWTATCLLKDGERWVTVDNYGRASN